MFAVTGILHGLIILLVSAVLWFVRRLVNAANHTAEKVIAHDLTLVDLKRRLRDIDHKDEIT